MIKLSAALFFILSLFSLGCEDETQIVTQTDTVLIQGPTRTQLLATGNWEVDAVYRHENGELRYYIKGGTNTTGTNYDNLRMKFELNGTGVYTDVSGINHDMVWEFTTTDQRNMRIVFGPPSSGEFIWTLVEIKDNYLHTTTMYGSNLISARYKSIP